MAGDGVGSHGCVPSFWLGQLGAHRSLTIIGSIRVTDFMGEEDKSVFVHVGVKLLVDIQVDKSIK